MCLLFSADVILRLDAEYSLIKINHKEREGLVNYNSIICTGLRAKFILPKISKKKKKTHLFASLSVTKKLRRSRSGTTETRSHVNAAIHLQTINRHGLTRAGCSSQPRKTARYFSYAMCTAGSSCRSISYFHPSRSDVPETSAGFAIFGGRAAASNM